MEFTESLLNRSLQTDMNDTLAMSNSRRNPESVMSLDEFFTDLNLFHAQSIQTDLMTALINNYEPVFTVGEVAVQLEETMDSLESNVPTQETSMDMQGY
ncbi:hypothetical protein [Vibrio sp. R78045]|uniref:hypothetical protein n=1 Tax=Vibrio sp. R78045 TaxID=3093868 RepID=UPI0036F200F3